MWTNTLKMLKNEEVEGALPILKEQKQKIRRIYAVN